MRILHLEDEPTDSELVELSLREAGLDWEIVRVDSRDGLLGALEQGGFDMVVSDYGLPSYNGIEALKEVRARRPDLAFVFFTATLGEERAVEALKAGATDFVVKGGRHRLVPALVRALREAESRAARLQAEDALRQREASFRVLFENNPHPMWVFDRESLRFLEVNGAAVDHYGYSRDEFLAMRIDDLQSAEDRNPRESSQVRIADTKGIVHSGPLRHRAKDGSLIHVMIVAHDLDFTGRPGRLVVAHDVTEQKKLEAQLHQSQKMEAVGQLAGGVAHDFNNLLNVITGYGDLLLRQLGPTHAGIARLQHIRRAAERGAGLTRQLLAFSRRQVLEPKVLDLNAALSDTQAMLSRLIGEHIQVVMSLDPATGPVRADPGQLEQVVMNLVINARDSMPEGGTLILETANVQLDEVYTRTRQDAKPGNYVRLSVSDTGGGMDAETLSRIFEPFFTTKPRGQGTGLGLATVYGIVKQSGGHVDVYSEVGRGSTFKVHLPRVEADDAAADLGRQDREATLGGSETVLLVEDDDAMRGLTRELLQEHGYVVLEASGPEGAFGIAESHSGSIDLLMTDVIMPKMNGTQLAAQMVTLRPQMRVLYMSGYTDEAIGRHGVIEAGTNFLQKPFTLQALLRKLRAVLDTPGVPAS
jgi:PAS domain S-box-containing protein